MCIYRRQPTTCLSLLSWINLFIQTVLQFCPWLIGIFVNLSNTCSHGPCKRPLISLRTAFTNSLKVAKHKYVIIQRIDSKQYLLVVLRRTYLLLIIIKYIMIASREYQWEIYFISMVWIMKFTNLFLFSCRSITF